MPKQRIQVSYRVIKDEGDTVIITPANDEIRIKKPNPEVTLSSTLIADIDEKNLIFVPPPKRLTY